MMNMPFLGTDFHYMTLRKTSDLRPETFQAGSLLQACSQRHNLETCIMLCVWCLWCLWLNSCDFLLRELQIRKPNRHVV